MGKEHRILLRGVVRMVKHLDIEQLRALYLYLCRLI